MEKSYDAAIQIYNKNISVEECKIKKLKTV